MHLDVVAGGVAARACAATVFGQQHHSLSEVGQALGVEQRQRFGPVEDGEVVTPLCVKGRRCSV